MDKIMADYRMIGGDDCFKLQIHIVHNGIYIMNYEQKRIEIGNPILYTNVLQEHIDMIGEPYRWNWKSILEFYDMVQVRNA